MPERILSRDELKAATLWLARMMLGYDGKPYSGPLRVSVVKTDERETVAIKPLPTLDGMVRPEWFALEVADEAVASASELLGALLSPDEQKLLTDLVGHQPCTATSVQDRCKQVLSKSDFWAVWGQLQKRQLVEEGDDGRYLVRPVWLAEWLKRKTGGKSAA